MAEGARRLVMPEVPEVICFHLPYFVDKQENLRIVHIQDIFLAAVSEAVSLNREHIPDYESGGAMYIRPLLFASGPMLPLKVTGIINLHLPKL